MVRLGNTSLATDVFGGGAMTAWGGRALRGRRVIFECGKATDLEDDDDKGKEVEKAVVVDIVGVVGKREESQEKQKSSSVRA